MSKFNVHKLIMILGLLFSLNLQAQKAITDSLSTVLNTVADDTLRLNVLNQMVKYLSRSYPDSALHLAFKAEKLAKKLHKMDQLGENYKFVGNIYFHKDTFLAAQKYYDQALQIFDQTKNQLGKAKIYNNLGALNHSKNNYVDALKYYQKSLTIREKLNDYSGMGKTFNNIGNVHFSQENYDLALYYYDKSLTIREKYNDQMGIAGCYSNMGLVYDMQGNHETAINNFQKAMAIYQQYDDILGIGETYKKIALSYLHMNAFKRSLKYFKQTLQIQKSLGDKMGQATTYMFMAEAYNKNLRFHQALTCEKQSMQIAQSLQVLSLYADVYKQMSITYEGLGDYKKALWFHKQFLQSKDSLFRINKTKAFENLEIRFQNKYQQLQIESLKSDNELKSLKLKRYKNQRIMLVLIIVIAASIITILALIRRRLQRKNQTIFDQNEEIRVQKEELEKYKQHLELIVQERTAAFLEAKEHAEESDRLKTAFLANMSHEIRTPLNAIVGFSNLFSMDAIEKKEALKFASIIQSNSSVLINLINDIIDIAKIEAGDFRISSCRVDITKLVNEVYQSFMPLLKGDNSKNIDMILDTEITDSLIISTDDTRMRQVLNNLISNAIKFTDKGFVKVGYRIVDDFVQFYVADTGTGISPDNLEIIFERFKKIEKNQGKFYRGTGLGLSISKHIVDLMGGKIWVTSKMGKGSTFYFKIPIRKE